MPDRIILLAAILSACGKPQSTPGSDGGTSTEDTASPTSIPDTVPDTASSPSGRATVLAIEPATIVFDAPWAALDYYQDAAPNVYCGADTESDTNRPGTTVGFPLSTGGKTPVAVTARVELSNTGADALYVAGRGDYNSAAEGDWALFQLIPEAPALRILPSSVWDSGVRVVEDTNGAILLPGETISMLLAVAITCVTVSGEYIEVAPGDVVGGQFMLGWAECLESPEDISRFGAPCTREIIPRIAAVPSELRIAEDE